MRNVQQTTVNVIVNDRSDRTNVVVASRGILLGLRKYLREAGRLLAKAFAEKHASHPGAGAMCWSPAWSPSWGGSSPSGRPGPSSRA